MKKLFLVFTIFATAFLFAQNDQETTIFGQVVGIAEDGVERPIEGAFIGIANSWQDSAFAISNGEGFYELSFVWNWYGPVEVICEAEGYHSETVTFFPEEYEVELNFTLIPEQDEIWGLLMGNVFEITSDGAPGEPIAGATILAYGENADEVYETHSGDNGHYTLQLPVGPYVVTCSAEDFQEQTVDLYVGDFIETQQDFYLIPSGQPGDDFRVFGHVFGTSGAGNPIPLAGAYLTAETTSPNEPIWETETNDAGMYEFFLPEDEYIFHAYFEGYETGEAVFYVGPNHENFHDFYLEPEGSSDMSGIFGHVFEMDEAGNHQPISGVLIQAMNEELNTIFEAVTGDDGHYEMEVLANLDYAVLCFVDASTEPLVQYVFVGNEPVEVNFMVGDIEPPMLVLGGRVLGGTSENTDDWMPLVGALIEAIPLDSPVDIFYYAETGEDGFYEMEMPAGMYYVTAFYEGYPPADNEIHVTPWGENILNFVLLTDPNPENAGIFGHVSWEMPDGEPDPIPGAHIIAYYDDTNTGFEAFTNESGYYEMETEANQHYFVTCTIEFAGMTMTQDAEIFIGEEWSGLNFHFGEEPPPEAAIFGHVWHATHNGDMQPIPGAMLEAVCENSSEIYFAESGNNGQYEMTVYPNSHYIVTCTVENAGGSWTQTQEVYVGDYPAELNFIFGQDEPEFGALHGFVGGITETGEIIPIAGARVFGMGPMQWTFEVFTNEEGLFFIEELQAFTYYVQVDAEGYHQANATVEIIANEVTEMEIVLEPAGEPNEYLMHGQVFGIEYDAVFPLAGAHISAVYMGVIDPVFETETDSTGYFEMMVFEGPYMVHVEHDGFQPLTEEAYIGPNSENYFEFYLQSGVMTPQIVGFVSYTTENGEVFPLDAFLRAQSLDGQVYEAVTNDAGHYEMNVQGHMYYSVSCFAFAQGDTLFAQENVFVENGAVELNFEFGAQPQDWGILAGYVRENCDFEPWLCPPIVGAVVVAYCENSDQEFVTSTDSWGHYAMELPVSGENPYTVYVAVESGFNDFIEDGVQIYPNEETVLDVWLDPIEEPNYEVFLDIGDATGMPGGEVTVPVYMTCNTEVAGWQFSLSDIPNAATVVDATTPFDDFTLSFADLGEYANFVAFSLSGGIIPAGEHLLMEITFQISDDISVAEHIELQPAEWVFSDPYANPIPAEAEGGIITFGMKGDVNMDGGVNILDVIIMVNFIIETVEPTEYEYWAADYNNDGVVNVLDIVAVVNPIIDPVSKVSATEATLQISSSGMTLVADGAVAGLQFTADRTYAIIVQTAADEIFAVGAEKGILISTIGELSTLSFDFTQPVEISEILVVNSSGEIVETTIEWIPDEFALLQNYPNPFNPTTTIEYQIAEDCEVNLNIYNLLGELVSVLVNYEQRSGYYSVSWNGTMADGSVAATGFYFARLQAGEFQSTVKMVLTK